MAASAASTRGRRCFMGMVGADGWGEWLPPTIFAGSCSREAVDRIGPQANERPSNETVRLVDARVIEVTLDTSGLESPTLLGRFSEVNGGWRSGSHRGRIMDVGG